MFAKSIYFHLILITCKKIEILLKVSEEIEKHIMPMVNNAMWYDKEEGQAVVKICD